MDFIPQALVALFQEGDIAHFVGNFLIVFILFVLIFVYALRIGKKGVIALTAATYIGLILYSSFPYVTVMLSFINGPFFSLVAILIILGIFIIVPYVVLSRVLARDYSTASQVIFSALASFFLTTLLIASAYHILGVGEYYIFTPALDTFFAPLQFFFWWLVAPTIFLFFSTR